MASSLINQTLPDKIAAVLSERIINGTYQPGERLTEAMLAKEFGVSHGPVRDALRSLENAGLVSILPYRGAQITELSIQEVKELYQVRAALVGLRARWIAEDARRMAFVSQVEDQVSRLATLAVASTKRDEYAAAALTLNRMFTEGVSNRWLRSMLQALTLQTARYTRLGINSPDRRRESAASWRKLLEAIRAGDADLAERIASENSLASRDAAIQYLETEQAAGSGSPRKAKAKEAE